MQTGILVLYTELSWRMKLVLCVTVCVKSQFFVCKFYILPSYVSDELYTVLLGSFRFIGTH